MSLNKQLKNLRPIGDEDLCLEKTLVLGRKLKNPRQIHNEDQYF